VASPPRGFEDVGGAELAGDLLPDGVAAERDDPGGAQPARS
jgi:hypothetical protein